MLDWQVLMENGSCRGGVSKMPSVRAMANFKLGHLEAAMSFLLGVDNADIPKADTAQMCPGD